MEVTLRPFSNEEFTSYCERSIKDYADSLVKSGTKSEESAFQSAADEFRTG